jgi:cell wall-associated NlpC family hydrolase
MRRWLSLLLLALLPALALASGAGDLATGKALAAAAAQLKGSPCRWGGASPAQGFDCSGFTQYVHAELGIRIPKRALDQFLGGQAVPEQALLPGDLVFFAPSGGGASMHVGVYQGQGRFWHAPGSGKRICLARMASPFFKLRFMGARRWRASAAAPSSR